MTADLVRHQESIRSYLTNLPMGDASPEARLEAYTEIARRLHWAFLLGSDMEAHAARRVAASAGLSEDANVASALFFDGKREEYFLDRVRTDPDDVNAYNNLGHIYRMQGRPDLAVQTLERALRLRPDFGLAQANLGRALRDVGELDRATQAFLALREMNPTPRVLAQVGRQLKILRLLRKLNYQPSRGALRNALLRAYLEDGEVMKAAAVARVSVTLDPGDVENWVFLARFYEQLDFPGRAAQAWARIEVLTPDDPGPRQRAEMLSRLRADPPARRTWLNRNKQVPTDKDVVDPLVGGESRHPEVCDRALETWSTLPVDGSVDRSQLEAVAEAFEEATRQAPDHLHAYRDATRVCEILGDHQRAAANARRGLAASPGHPGLTLTLRRLDLLQMIEGDDSGPDRGGKALLELGALQLQSGDAEGAHESFQRALEEGPAGSRSWIGLASAQEEIGHYEAAIDSLERALAADPMAELEPLARQRLAMLRTVVGHPPESSWSSLLETADLWF